jgi:hypothetical protein
MPSLPKQTTQQSFRQMPLIAQCTLNIPITTTCPFATQLSQLLRVQYKQRGNHWSALPMPIFASSSAFFCCSWKFLCAVHGGFTSPYHVFISGRSALQIDQFVGLVSAFHRQQTRTYLLSRSEPWRCSQCNTANKYCAKVALNVRTRTA